MFKHFVIITPYHKTGHRIAWHKVLEQDDDFHYAREVLKRIQKSAGDLNVATHIITTDSRSPQSIVEKDEFFKDVAFYDDEKHFIDQYKEELELTANDIATFIISVNKKITHLKLQKLIYLCYEDFMRDTGTALFKDKIYAFPLGPVVMNVYEKYKGKNASPLKIEEDDSIFLGSLSLSMKPSLSKILFSEAGIGALHSITRTLEKYIEYSAYDLVELTHKKNTPWDKVYKKGVPAKEIPTDLIQEYSYN